MRKRSGIGGFEFLSSSLPTYYKNLKSRSDDVLNDEQIKEYEELTILVDRDYQGTVLQIFTKPVGDRVSPFDHAGCGQWVSPLFNSALFYAANITETPRSLKGTGIFSPISIYEGGNWRCRHRICTGQPPVTGDNGGRCRHHRF
nr:4-hydroxyphenylpyruvate dioxygenase [Ipomoea batatas]